MTRIHDALACAAAVLGLAAASSGAAASVQAARLAGEIVSERHHISAPELADRLMRGDPKLKVFDLRSAAEYGQLHVPAAKPASVHALVDGNLPRDATIVLYSEGGAQAAQAWVLLRLRGYQHVLVLREGLYEWVSRVIEPRLATDATALERAEFERAAMQSRFFGGVPREGVARAEVPTGYWTAGPRAVDQRLGAAVAAVRRRGC